MINNRKQVWVGQGSQSKGNKIKRSVCYVHICHEDVKGTVFISHFSDRFLQTTLVGIKASMYGNKQVNSHSIQSVEKISTTLTYFLLLWERYYVNLEQSIFDVLFELKINWPHILLHREHIYTACNVFKGLVKAAWPLHEKRPSTIHNKQERQSICHPVSLTAVQWL